MDFHRLTAEKLRELAQQKAEEDRDDSCLVQLGSLKARKHLLQKNYSAPALEKKTEDELNTYSMLYQSRCKIPGRVVYTNKQRWISAITKPRFRREKKVMNSTYKNTRPGATLPKQPAGTNMRTCCAESLYQLSCQSGSEKGLIEAGAVEQLVDFAEVDDAELNVFVAATLVNITTNVEMQFELARRRGTIALLELCWSPVDQVKELCVLALCRLSIHKALVSIMVNDNIVLELLSIMNISNIHAQKLCIQTIINMISNGSHFPDRVFSGGTTRSKHALIPVLLQFAAAPEQRSFVAHAVYLISLCPHSAERTLHVGVMEILALLSASSVLQDPVSQEHIVQAFTNFSYFMENYPAILPYASKIVSNFLTLKQPQVMKKCASAMANLSSQEELCRELIQHQIFNKALFVDLFSSESLSCKLDVIRTIANLSQSVEGADLIVKQELVGLLHQAACQEPQVSRDNGDLLALEYDAIIVMVNLSRYPGAAVALAKNNLDRIFHRWVTTYFTTATEPQQQLYAEATRRFVYVEALRQSYVVDEIIPILIHSCEKEDALAPVAHVTIGALCCLAQQIIASDMIKKSIALVLSTLDQTFQANGTTLPNAGISNSSGHSYQELQYACSLALYKLALNSHDRELSLHKFELVEAIETSLVELILATKHDKTQQCCVSVLFHICKAGKLPHKSVFDALVNAARTTADGDSSLACAMAMSVLSATKSGRQKLFETPNIGEALTSLGRSSNAQLQYYASVATCNIASVGNPWNSTQIADAVVVALLRTGAVEIQGIHAKTLFNLLCHKSTREAIASEALYALMKLAQLELQQKSTLSAPAARLKYQTLVVCFQSLFNLSCLPSCHALLLDLGVIQLASALANTKSKSLLSELPSEASMSSTEVLDPLLLDARRLAAATLCQLSQDKSCHLKLLNGQVTDAARSLAKANDIETRTLCTMVLRNLTAGGETLEYLSTRKNLALLQQFIKSLNPSLKHLAMQTLCNFSCSMEAIPLFMSLGITHQIISLMRELTLDDIEHSQQSFSAALQIVHNVAFDTTSFPELLDYELITALDEQKQLISGQSILISAQLLHYLAMEHHHAPRLVNPQMVALMSFLLTQIQSQDPQVQFPVIEELSAAAAQLTVNKAVHTALVREDFLPFVGRLSHSKAAAADANIRWRCTIALYNLSVGIKTAEDDGGASSSVQFNIFQDSLDEEDDEQLAPESPDVTLPPALHRNFLETIPLLQELVSSCEENADVMFYIAATLTNYCHSDIVRSSVVQAKGISTLIRISKCQSEHVKQTCAVALHHLAIRKEALIEAGLPELLLAMLDYPESYISKVLARIREIFIPVQVKIPIKNSRLPLMGATKLCFQSFRKVHWKKVIVQVDSLTTPCASLSSLNETPSLPESFKQCLAGPRASDTKYEHTGRDESRYMPTHLRKYDLFADTSDARDSRKLKPRHSLRSLPVQKWEVSPKARLDSVIDAQMRKTRRNCRRNSSLLPPLSPINLEDLV